MVLIADGNEAGCRAASQRIRHQNTLQGGPGGLHPLHTNHIQGAFHVHIIKGRTFRYHIACYVSQLRGVATFAGPRAKIVLSLYTPT